MTKLQRTYRGRQWARHTYIHWLVALALMTGANAPVPTAAATSNTEENASVLQLQRLVDTMLATTADSTAAQDTDILDLQQALLGAEQSEPDPGVTPPAHETDAVLPLPVRSPVLLAHIIPGVLDALLSRQRPATIRALRTDHPPPVNPVERRYQFHLLSNAPPPARA